MILTLRELIGNCRNRHTSHTFQFYDRAGIVCLKECANFSGRQSKPGEGTQCQRGNACWLSIVPYFSLCVGPSTLPTDSGGRKTYLSNRILPQRATCIVSFSCPMSLPSSHHDEERRAWAKAELVNYVTGSASWLSNGLLKVGRASRVQLLMSVKTLRSFFIVNTDCGWHLDKLPKWRRK